MNNELCKIHNMPIIGHVYLLGEKISPLCEECFDKRPQLPQVFPCINCGSKPTLAISNFLYYCKICDPTKEFKIYKKYALIQDAPDVIWNKINEQ